MHLLCNTTFLACLRVRIVNSMYQTGGGQACSSLQSLVISVVCCSMSLSSLDSEQDDPFLDQMDSAGSTRLLVTGPAGGRRAVRSTGGASTHSLNEADLQVSQDPAATLVQLNSSNLMASWLLMSLESILAYLQQEVETVHLLSLPYLFVCMLVHLHVIQLKNSCTDRCS
jgi:hypothetical protein